MLQRPDFHELSEGIPSKNAAAAALASWKMAPSSPEKN
jgi:hypothetical protein